MENTRRTDAIAATDLTSVILMTDNAVLAIDIEDALKSVGFGSWTVRGDDFLEVKKQPNLAAAIVDVNRGDTMATTAAKWFAEQRIPTFVITTNDEALRGLEQYQDVVKGIEMPFCPDTILPEIIAASKI